MAEDAKKSPKNWIIAAVVALLVIAGLVFFMSQNGRGGDQTSPTSDSMPAEDGRTAAPAGG